MSQAQINYTISITAEDNLFTLTAKINSAINIQKELFTYLKKPGNGIIDEYVRIFQISDLYEYNNIRIDDNKDYYRKDTVVLNYTSGPSALQAKVDIEEELNERLDEYNEIITKIPITETIIYPES